MAKKNLTVGDAEKLVEEVATFIEESNGQSQLEKRLLLRVSIVIFASMYEVGDGDVNDELSDHAAAYYQDIRTYLASQ